MDNINIADLPLTLLELLLLDVMKQELDRSIEKGRLSEPPRRFQKKGFDDARFDGGANGRSRKQSRYLNRQDDCC
ncbi:hypothetical protein O9X99_09435 [Agrobacterium salinitolerans]|uniref:Transposase n=1 Tax=Agrobacterium salinitolerans TaxID=1183413 RepID=A0ABY3BS18_9HYPH|nr:MULTISPECIES: hypothetical protein [Agrobacterium]MCZ7891895.1 hypothetical protein [Agrobacterium salinitolerans]TRA94053.1 hypothetical protein EXN23_10240 [Agrobacterium salinitolerans]